MGIKGMTEFEESILTDNERAALEQGDADDAAAEAADDAPTGTPDAPVTEMVADDDKEEDEKAPAADAAEPPASEGEVPAEEPAEEAPRARTDAFVMPESEARDYDAEAAELGKQILAIAKQLEDGEITMAEGTAKQFEIMAAQAKLAKDQAKAEMAREINDAQWGRDVKRFLRDNQQYKSPVLYSALNAALAEVNRDTANASLDGDELLERAHALVSKEFGVVPPKAGTPRARPLPKPGEAEAKAIKAAPKTLADVPSADDAATGADRYVHLDRLGGIDLENALSKMSDAESDAYLAGRS